MIIAELEAKEEALSLDNSNNNEKILILFGSRFCNGIK